MLRAALLMGVVLSMSLGLASALSASVSFSDSTVSTASAVATFSFSPSSLLRSDLVLTVTYPDSFALPPAAVASPSPTPLPAGSATLPVLSGGGSQAFTPVAGLNALALDLDPSDPTVTMSPSLTYVFDVAGHLLPPVAGPSGDFVLTLAEPDGTFVAQATAPGPVLTAGPFSGASVTVLSPTAGSPTAIEFSVSFGLASNAPTGSVLSITLPPSFGTPGPPVLTQWSSSPPIDGLAAVSISGKTLNLVFASEVNAAVTFTVSGFTSPTASGPPGSAVFALAHGSDLYLQESHLIATTILPNLKSASVQPDAASDALTMDSPITGTYRFRFKPATTLPDVGGVHHLDITLPPGFDLTSFPPSPPAVFPGSVIGASNLPGASIAARTAASTITVDIDGTVDANVEYGFTLPSITAPSTSGSTMPFVFATRDGASPSVIVDSSLNVPGLSFSPAPLSSVSADTSSYQAGASVILSLTFQPSFTIPTGAYISLSLPAEFGSTASAALVTSSFPAASQSTVSGSVITIGPTTAPISHASPSSLDIDGLTNPTAAGSTSPFALNIHAAAALDSPSYNRDASFGGIAIVPSFTNPSVSASPLQVGAGNIALSLSFTPPVEIAPGSTLSLTLPTALFFSGVGSATCGCTGLGVTPASISNTASAFTIVLDSDPGAALPAGSPVSLTFNDIVAPLYASPAQDFTLAVHAPTAGPLVAISENIPGLAFASVGFTSASVALANSDNSATTALTLTFDPVLDVADSDSIVLSYPPEFDMTSAAVSSGPAPNVAAGSGSTLVLSGMSGILPAGTPVPIVLSGVQNPAQAGTSISDFGLAVQSSGAAVSMSDAALTAPTLTPAAFASATLVSSSLQPGLPTVLSLSFSVAVQRPKDSVLRIKLPAGYVVDPVVTFGPPPFVAFGGSHTAPPIFTAVRDPSDPLAILVTFKTEPIPASSTVYLAITSGVTNPSSAGTPGQTELSLHPSADALSVLYHKSMVATGDPIVVPATAVSVDFSTLAHSSSPSITLAFTLPDPLPQGAGAGLVTLHLPTSFSIPGTVTATAQSAPSPPPFPLAVDPTTASVTTVTGVHHEISFARAALDLVAAQQYVLVISGVDAPTSAVATGDLTLIITDGSNAVAHVREDIPGSTFTPKAFDTFYVGPVAPTIAFTGNFEIRFRPSSGDDVPAGGSVVLDAPAGFVFASDTIVPGGGVTELLSPTVTIDSVSDSRVVVATSATLSYTEYSIFLNKVTNPAVLGTSGSFTLTTRDTNGNAINTAVIPGADIIPRLAAASISVTSPVVATTTSAQIDITPAADIPADGVLTIDFPSSFVVASSIALAALSGEPLPGPVSITTVSPRVSVSLSGQAPLVAGTTYSFVLNAITMPSLEEAPSDNFVITAYTAGSAALLANAPDVPGVHILPAPFTNAALTSDLKTTPLADSLLPPGKGLVLTFTPTLPVGAGGSLTLELPASMTIGSAVVLGTAASALPNDLQSSVTLSYSFDVISGRYTVLITLTAPLTAAPSDPYSLRITGISNPLASGTTAPFSLTSRPTAASSGPRLNGNPDNIPGMAFSPAPFVIASLVPSSVTAGVSGTLNLVFNPQVSVPRFATLRLTLPVGYTLAPGLSAPSLVEGTVAPDRSIDLSKLNIELVTASPALVVDISLGRDALASISPLNEKYVVGLSGIVNPTSPGTSGLAALATITEDGAIVNAKNMASVTFQPALESAHVSLGESTAATLTSASVSFSVASPVTGPVTVCLDPGSAFTLSSDIVAPRSDASTFTPLPFVQSVFVDGTAACVTFLGDLAPSTAYGYVINGFTLPLATGPLTPFTLNVLAGSSASSPLVGSLDNIDAGSSIALPLMSLSATYGPSVVPIPGGLLDMTVDFKPSASATSPSLSLVFGSEFVVPSSTSFVSVTTSLSVASTTLSTASDGSFHVDLTTTGPLAAGSSNSITVTGLRLPSSTGASYPISLSMSPASSSAPFNAGTALLASAPALAPLASLDIIASSLTLGSTSAQLSIRFTPSTLVPSNGRIVFNLPADMAAASFSTTPFAAAFASATALDSSITASTLHSNTVFVISLGNHQVLVPGTAYAFGLSGVTLPSVGGPTQMFTLTTTLTDPAVTGIESLSAPGLTVEPESLTSTSFVPTTAEAGVTTDVVIAYTSPVAIPADSSFVLAVPSGVTLPSSPSVVFDAGPSASSVTVLPSGELVAVTPSLLSSTPRTITIKNVRLDPVTGGVARPLGQYHLSVVDSAARSLVTMATPLDMANVLPIADASVASMSIELDTSSTGSYTFIHVSMTMLEDVRESQTGVIALDIAPGFAFWANPADPFKFTPGSWRFPSATPVSGMKLAAPSPPPNLQSVVIEFDTSDSMPNAMLAKGATYAFTLGPVATPRVYTQAMPSAPTRAAGLSAHTLIVAKDATTSHTGIVAGPMLSVGSLASLTVNVTSSVVTRPSGLIVQFMLNTPLPPAAALVLELDARYVVDSNQASPVDGAGAALVGVPEVNVLTPQPGANTTMVAIALDPAAAGLAANTMYAFALNRITNPGSVATSQMEPFTLSVFLDTSVGPVGPTARSSVAAPEWVAPSFDLALVTVGPGPGATDVGLDASITIPFTTAMDRNSTQGAFSLSALDASILNILSRRALSRSGAGSTVAGSFAWNDASTSMTFSPNENLLPGTLYQVAVDGSARDAEGVPFTPFAYNFTTVTQPIVASSKGDSIWVWLAPVIGVVIVLLLATVIGTFVLTRHATRSAAARPKHSQSPNDSIKLRSPHRIARLPNGSPSRRNRHRS